MLAETISSGMRKDIEIKGSTYTACLRSDKNIKCELTFTERIKLPVLTESVQELQFDFSGKLHDKHVTGEPYVLIGNDQ